MYEPFYADFGPLNLGLAFSFCQKTKRLLEVGMNIQTEQLPQKLRKQAASQLNCLQGLGPKGWNKRLPHSYLGPCLQEGDRLKKRVYFCTGPHVHQKANAAVLVGYSALQSVLGIEGRSPARAHQEHSSWGSHSSVVHVPSICITRILGLEGK